MRSRNGIDDLVEQRFQGFRFVSKLFFGNTVARYRIKDREFDLLIICAEIDKQVVDLIHNFFGPGVLPIDLIYQSDRREF